jgi:sec-independent protein translocase protein TatA
MGNLGFPELVVIFLVGLLVLGPKRLPELARGIGEAFRAFQDAMRGIKKD